MLIGILSDTHDRADAMAAGLKVLRQNGAEMLIHCGDVGGQNIVDLMAGLKGLFVWGNTDFNQAALSQYAADLGVDCRGELAELEVDGKKIAVTHGHDHQIMSRIRGDKSYDYLLHGHTHIASDTRAGRLRIINPGALHRTSRKSVALLDLRKDELRFLPVAV
jgi:uncharacterized protein